MAGSMRKLYLVRHAESLWNKERKVQGSCCEVPLSETGRIQAGLLGGRLKDLSFGKVYCSDALRAAQTAELAIGKDHPVRFSKELRELSLGAWEGRLISEIEAECPGEIGLWYRNPTQVHIDGGEDMFSFRDRSVRAIEGIVESSGRVNVLVITHGGIICSYLTHILNMDLDDIWSFSLPNASITTVVLDFRPRLRSFGDTSFLDGGAAGLDGMPASQA